MSEFSALSGTGKPANIRIIHNMARSGGTQICRCLAAMRDIRLLGEIHPLGHRNPHFNAAQQYQNWYSDPGVDDLMSLGFDRAIDQLHQHCQESGKLLVLRDWAHIDFIGSPARRAPGFTLSLNTRLCDRYRLLRCVIARHPVKSWRSLSKMSVIIDNNISLHQFLEGYGRYLDAVGDCTIIRYEDFTLNRMPVMERLCAAIDVPFDPDFMDRWQDYRNITGDMHNPSRGSGSTVITHFPVTLVDAEIEGAVRFNEDYHAIMTRLGYPMTSATEVLATLE